MLPTSTSVRREALPCRTLAFVLAIAASSLTAQSGSVEASVGFMGPAERAVDPGVDIPPPPRVVAQLPTHEQPWRLPVGDGTLPPPDSPPAPPTRQAGGPGAPCSPNMHRLTQVAVAPGGLTSNVGEPSAAVRAETGATGASVFFTHNWHAGRSVDSGASFTPVSPFTLFPALDGGFCCDQRATYSPEFDITIWYLQYVKSATTQQGSVRIAIADGANLNAGSTGTWHYYDWNPSFLGLPAGHWLDFPDIVVTDRWMYATSNVFRIDSDAYVDSVIWKMPLQAMKSGGSFAWYYWRGSAASPYGGALGGQGSYRFAQGAAGSASRSMMFAATHVTTTSMRLYRNQPSSTTMTWIDRTIPAWNDPGRGSYVARAPNGVNWLYFVDGRISGGFATDDEYGFVWTAAQNGGSRPLPYIRLQKFRISDDALVESWDLANSQTAYAYPACATNLAGHLGVVAAQGEGNGNPAGVHPSTFFFLRDPCSGYDGGQYFSFGTSSPNADLGPGRARWGDYFTVQQDPLRPLKFTGTGMSMANGGAPANQRMHYVGFGREQDNLGWVSVGIQSTPVSGVPIGCTTDKLGKSTVVTAGYASYDPNSNYVLTAPKSVTSGGIVYGFERWRYRDDWRFVPIDRQLGNQILSVNTGADDDRAQAVYQQATRVTIGSRNPTSGVGVAINRLDLQDNQDGTTPFVRYYRGYLSENATFTAPAMFGLQRFNRWYVDGVPQAQGNRSVAVQFAGPTAVTVEAEYCTHVPGSLAPFGTGCLGSNGLTPRHFSNSTGNAGTTTVYEIADVQPNSSMALYLGFSNTAWGSIPLPLNLGFLGMDPSCDLLVEPFFIAPFSSDGGGRGSKSVPIPDFIPIGTKVYTQVHCLDFGVSAPLKVTVSGGLVETTGGNVCN